MPAALRGSLSAFPLDLVLGLIADASITGRLEVGSGTSRGTLEITDGRPTAARHAGASGEAALVSLASLAAAPFEFVAGETGAADLALTMDALRERIRSTREAERELRRDIPSDRHTFVLSETAASGAAFNVTAQHLRILRAVEGHRRDVAHVGSASGLDRETTLRNLRELMSEGIVEIRPPVTARERAQRPPRAPKRAPAAAADVAAAVDDRAAALSTPAAPEPPVADGRLAALASAPPRSEPAAEPPRVRPNILIGANEAPPAERPRILIGANEPKPAPMPPAPNAELTATPRAEPAAASAAEETPAEDEDAGSKTSIFVSQYLPQGSTIPIVAPKPPPKRGIFDLFAGFGKHRADIAPAGKDPLYSPRHVAVLVNALLFGYFGAEAEARGRGLREAIAEVSSRGLSVEPQLPISDGRIDAPALEKGAYSNDTVVAVLHAVVRHLFDEDVRVQSGEHARRVFDAAVDQTVGSGARIHRDALRIVGEGMPLSGRLVIQHGGSGGPFELEERAYGIGRSSTNDIVLHDPSVSRQHARIFARSGRFVVADSGSTGGTRVDGEPVKAERVLRGGETITVGEVALKLEMVDR